MRMRSLPRAAAAVALAALLAGCDSLPESIGPSTRDLLSTFAIWNDTPAPMTQVLVHPNKNIAPCTQHDSTATGGLATFVTRTGEGRDINLKAGCYVLFVRWQGQPGHMQLATSLDADDYESVRLRTLPAPTAANPIDGSLRITNAATSHTASISRIYTDACATNRIYGVGNPGGATTDNQVNVAVGSSVTIPLPRACHLVTVLWSNGAYQFGTYGITGTNTLSVGN